jgi:hypothetical protein
MTDEVINPPADADAGATAIVDTSSGAAPNAPAAGDTQRSIAQSDPANDKAVTTPADWPEDWRDKFAGQDEKLRARLNRFQSPLNVLKSWREAEAKLSSGEYRRPLPSDAKPEDVAAWRKENGIPEKPDDYEFKLEGGIVPSEADKPMLDAFKGFVHSNNIPPGDASRYVNWYFQQQEQVAVQQQHADKVHRETVTEELRSDWGSEYRSNINAIQNFLQSTAPDGLAETLYGARGPDGRMLGDNPNVLRWLTALARENAPGAGLIPAGSSNIGKGVNDRIAEIEKVMSSTPHDYWRDEKMQAEYGQLLTAREKMQSRAT